VHAYITGGPRARMHTLLRGSVRTYVHVAEEQRARMYKHAHTYTHLHTCTHMRTHDTQRALVGVIAGTLSGPTRTPAHLLLAILLRPNDTRQGQQK